ncbi:MAG: ATP-binding cassette domain-containing protein [Bacteroidales bacterium]|nr:ATP-binding cassette domain-containing protein [Bacteroidales bacterium]MCF8352533.1 ATP-binding cassette domain-containing protein [Bacteroidales bacterium]MCF8377791.1 ATP-binding cassette domain-containing protein [Bacteroidales bacterium]
MKEDIAIKVENVSKTFVQHNRGKTIRDRLLSVMKSRNVRKIKALDAIDFEIKKGEFFGIIGHNGSGKSTLISILNQVVPPDKGGKVTVNGTSIRLALGMGFNKELTARQNIMINASVLGMPMEKIKLEIGKIIEFAELEDYIDIPVKYYSSGMRSKLMFSIAVNAKADIFLMDEFFGGVGDKKYKEKADQVFHDRLIKGKTIVHVSHNPGTIEKYCDRVLLLEKGKMVKLGTPDEVLELF